MKNLSIKKIGEELARAGRLSYRPLCVHGTSQTPSGSAPTTAISFCVAEAIFALAADSTIPALYVGGDGLKNCCGGGTSYLGFTRRSSYIKYFVSYGTKEFRNGAAEYLRATPKLVEENARSVGKITPPGKYVVVRPCSDLDDKDPGVRSILLFGEAENIRNLCSLVHFRSANAFKGILAPSGPSCASFITYAAGMAAKGPKDAAIIGPFDPTGNCWFPPNLLSLALPIKMARRMCDDLPQTFLKKRMHIAFPEKRSSIELPK